MNQVFVPQGYRPILNSYETQLAIGMTKRLFADVLSGQLNLRRVSAPLFLEAATGLNDDLNGVERPVSFDIRATGTQAQVVHSLAKWKRQALKDYGFHTGSGLYTDMNAIRRDEDLDNLHSIYVDQWDWERIMEPQERTLDYLKETVRKIVFAVRSTERTLHSMYPALNQLPTVEPDITFVTAQELEDLYPGLSPKEREDAFVRTRPCWPANCPTPSAAASARAACVCSSWAAPTSAKSSAASGMTRPNASAGRPASHFCELDVRWGTAPDPASP